VSFDSDERLSTIDVGVTNDSGYSVTLTSFTETNNGDGTYTYTESVDVGGTGNYDAALNIAEDDAGNDGANGRSDTVVVTKPGLFTAVSPDPNDGTSDSTEFVRIKFPADNTTGWQIEAGSDGDTVDITSDLNGELYLAQNRQDFIERWGIDESKVASTELSGLALLNSGENLLLKDASGVVRDEFGYEGEQTSSGWDISLGSGQVAVRKTEAGGAYQDTNSAADWRIEDGGTFFGGESPPGLTSVTVEKAPLNQSDTGASLDVTLTFDKTMDSGIDPTVGLGGLASSGNYNSSLSSGTWSNDDTTWTSSFTLNDDNEEVTSTIEVTGAESQFGTTMSRNTSNSVVVDTKTPTVQRFDLTNPSGTTFQVEIESDEALSEISVDVEDSTGSIVTTLTRSDFSEAQSGTTFTYTESYTASSGGEYTAVLNTARDSLLNDGASGQTDTASTNAPPNAQFSFGPTDPLTGEQINFDGSGSNDPDGSIASYEWDWTDDGTYDDTGQMPTHTYSDSGTYTVRLRVTDDDGTTSTTTQSVTVTPRPTLSSKIVDQGQTGSGSLARYETSYNVTNRSVFDRVEVTYNNLDSGGADQTYTRTDPRTNVDGYGWTDTYGGTGGDTYEVTIEVFDTSGAVVDSRTVTDDADGSDPAGNADLSEASSPQLSNRAIQDTSKNSNANYDVNYTVSDSAGRFTETEILFYNRDTATATGQKTGTQLTEVLSYSAGGAEGDTYDIIIQVQDDDGIVVDSETITDVADGTGFTQPGIVFAGKSNGKLSTIDSEGRVARSVYGVTGTTAAGPQTTDFESGNSPEVPFKNGNGELGVVDVNGNKEILVGTNYGPGINDARLAVGTVFVGNGNSLQTNGGPFVYFINGNGKLTRVDNNETVTVMEARNANTQGNGQELISAQSVAGTGDVDGDGAAELVFVDSNSQLDYLNESSSGKATTVSLSGSPTLNTPNAVGAPADFDGDGAAEIPYINGNKEVSYVNGPDGTDTAGSTIVLTTGAGGEHPVGVADVAGDVSPEVIYVDTSGKQRLAYAGTGSISGFIKDFSGNEDPVKKDTGAS
jgi:PKD repeat protein